jgi:SAM-dependent methyltransferase
MDSSRPLADAPDRSYAAKLDRFALFAAPEIQRILEDFAPAPGAVALDLGCGTGIATGWLEERVAPGGYVVGLDLSRPHLRAASAQGARALVQADAGQLCFRDAAFDFIWSCNTLNHLAAPVDALRALRASLRGDGRIVLAQTGFLPEMFFAWDTHLDDAVRRACHAYYRERYSLEPGDTAALRGLPRLVQAAGLRLGRVRTYVIERLQPLSAADRAYFETSIFAETWGQRLKPYLQPAEWAALRSQTDPGSADYCLARADFHHLQTLTACEALP